MVIGVAYCAGENGMVRVRLRDTFWKLPKFDENKRYVEAHTCLLHYLLYISLLNCLFIHNIYLYIYIYTCTFIFNFLVHPNYCNY